MLPHPLRVGLVAMVMHVIGASGRSGLAFCRALVAEGAPFVPVVRDVAKWRATGLPVDPVVADLQQPGALASALAPADVVVSCVHGRHAAAIIEAAVVCRRFVLLGSTRKFTQWPDSHGLGVLAGEDAFRRSGRPGVMLHPTMIYGAQGEDNVQRLARLLRRLPIVPLPGGGRSLVQPIHQDDVTRALRAAADIAWQGQEFVLLAGGDRVRYADFVRAVARAAGLPPPRIVPIPGALLRAAAPIMAMIPGVPRVRQAEVRRLMEDKSFDIAPMRRLLGVAPIGLAEGLALTFGS